jgi:hypothetical protein
LEILRFITADQIRSLWGSRDIGEWRSALASYWNQIKREKFELETFMNNLILAYIETLNADGWCAFLHDKYFPWKFTPDNVLRANLQHLEKYKTTNRLEELLFLKERLFNFALAEIEEGLKIALEVKGLGASGASGLLAILFPKWFGTVDQFVVKTLARVESLPERPQILQMQPRLSRRKTSS